MGVDDVLFWPFFEKIAIGLMQQLVTSPMISKLLATVDAYQNWKEHV